MGRSTTLRRHYMVLPPGPVERRRTHLARVLGDGSYLDPEEQRARERALNRRADDPAELPKNPLTDPAAMEPMMEQGKKSLVMMVPQTVIMGWINFFFSGFVLSA